MKSTLTNKALKLDALIAAVECLNNGEVARPDFSTATSLRVDNKDVNDMDIEEEMDGEDTDIG
jgi:hypothetical protein